MLHVIIILNLKFFDLVESNKLIIHSLVQSTNYELYDIDFLEYKIDESIQILFLVIIVVQHKFVLQNIEFYLKTIIS